MTGVQTCALPICAKPCSSKGSRDFPALWGKRDTTHGQKASLGAKSQGTTPGRKESCFSQKPLYQGPSWLRGVCTPRGKVLRQISQGLKQDVWPEGRQRTELQNWFNCLFPMFLLTRVDTDILSLQVFISALLPSYLNSQFLRVLFRFLLRYVSNNKLCTCI